MRTRLAMLIVAGTLAITPACRGTKDRPEIRNVLVLAESARDAVVKDSAQKPPGLPAENAAGTAAHQRDAVNATPQPVKKPGRMLERVKLRGEYSKEIMGLSTPLEYTGSR